MKKEEADRLIKDFMRKPNRTQDPDLSTIEAALFLEQTFGAMLVDDDFMPDLARSQVTLERYITARIEQR